MASTAEAYTAKKKMLVLNGELAVQLAAHQDVC